jgi:nucleoside triphosphate diphosphatase
MNDSFSSEEATTAFGRLVEIIRTLRSENGCPWDQKQTPESFHPYILEEYHEMVQAVHEGDHADIIDEMGDLTFLVIFVGYMFQQQGFTTLQEILEKATAKMVRRHPHVFGTEKAKDDLEVVEKWNKIKASEESIRKRDSHLDGIPRSLPALSRAQRITKRAAGVGFDWTEPHHVFAKVEEELQEFREAVETENPDEMRKELGDLLFSIVNAARLYQINAEAALDETSDRFERRFRHIEAELKAQNRTLKEAGLEEMDRLWDEAKERERDSVRGST